MPLGGTPPLQSRGQNQKWPTSGQGGYITPAAWGNPTASEPGTKSEVAHKWARWLHNPCHLGEPHRFKAGDGIKSGPQVGRGAKGTNFSGAQKRVELLPNPYFLGDPQKGGIDITKDRPAPAFSGVQKKGGNATSPLHYGGSLANGTKLKVAELGARTKLWMCSPKEYHQKKNSHKWCVCVEKHP